MSYGPHPWQQTSWDWRAAGNFLGGGVGSGLLVVGAVLGGPGPLGLWSLLVGLACVGLGLLCVWLEIGRPLRALHVFYNPRTSWMSREAWVAALLFPLGLLVLLGWDGGRWALAALALAYLYCQGRILPAARGIPAWRPRALTHFILATGLAEGCGLWLLLAAFASGPSTLAWALLVVLTLLRQWLWGRYRTAVDAALAPRARQALDDGGRTLLVAGTLGAAAALLGLLLPQAAAAVLAGAAGALALGSGAAAKAAVVTRAAFNQGFALPRTPVRGVRTPH
ncbi:MAG: hypothetical protein ACT4NV_18255 [Rhodoferax sp.]